MGAIQPITRSVIEKFIYTIQSIDTANQQSEQSVKADNARLAKGQLFDRRA